MRVDKAPTAVPFGPLEGIVANRRPGLPQMDEAIDVGQGDRLSRLGVARKTVPAVLGEGSEADVPAARRLLVVHGAVGPVAEPDAQLRRRRIRDLDRPTDEHVAAEVASFVACNLDGRAGGINEGHVQLGQTAHLGPLVLLIGR